MERADFSQITKDFLRRVVLSGDKWLIDDIQQIFKTAEDEQDFLEELSLYLARLELKIKTIKEEFDKIAHL